MSATGLRELVARLNLATSSLSVLASALREGADAAPGTAGADGERRQGRDQVLRALGAQEMVQAAGPNDRRMLLAEIEIVLRQALARLDAGGGTLTAGWSRVDDRMLQAAGEVSAGFPALLERQLPDLPGLGARLAGGGARFLDVGVGVGALSVALAQRWRGLQIVGIDVNDRSLALARDHIQRAGLNQRIELRQQPVQALEDESSFDLVWLPSAFIPGPAIAAALPRVRGALRPGGWLLFATAYGGPDPLGAALARLRNLEWGGDCLAPEQAQALLAGAGFNDVRTLAGPPGAHVALIAGRAAPDPPRV